MSAGSNSSNRHVPDYNESDDEILAQYFSPIDGVDSGGAARRGGRGAGRGRSVGRGRGQGRGRGGRPPRGNIRASPAGRANRRNNVDNDAIAIDMSQFSDPSTVARILGTDSQSMMGQALPTGLQRISNQISNIERARGNIRDMDAILNEIEQY